VDSLLSVFLYMFSSAGESEKNMPDYGQACGTHVLSERERHKTDHHNRPASATLAYLQADPFWHDGT